MSILPDEYSGDPEDRQSRESRTHHWLERELRQRFREDASLLDFLEGGSLDGLWYWDLEGGTEEWLSPGFKALFGYADDEMENTVAWWQKNIHPDDLAQVLDNFNKHLADPSHSYDQVVRYRHRQGHMVWVRCRGRILRDADGKPIRMLGAHIDVTAQKLAEEKLACRNADLQVQLERLRLQERQLEAQAEELTTMNETLEAARHRLEQLNAQKDRFFAIVAHDLKSPFTPLMGFSELLATQGEHLPPERVVEYGSILNRAATEAFKLLDDLLEWSRLQLERVCFTPDVIDLQSLVRTNIARYAVMAGSKDVTLEAHDLGAMATYADPSMVDSILRNLISNAIKFTPAGGSVTVTLGAEDDRVLVTVADTGIGIPADRMEALGTVDSGSSAGTLGEKGTGLGLVICKDLAERQGGALSLSSVEGKGTTAVLRLPAG